MAKRITLPHGDQLTRIAFEMRDQLVNLVRRRATITLIALADQSEVFERRAG
jgi:hypothetical protein